MRVHIGPVPNSPDFRPDESWTLMPEPTPWVMQLCAMPLGIFLTLLLIVLWFALTPIGKGPPPSALEFFGALLAIMPAHEAVHILAHPRTGNSIIGFWPSSLLFYTHYQGELRRGRFLTILLLPIVGISLLPLALCVALGTASLFLAVASVVNALFASGDLFAVALQLFQVPRNTVLRNYDCRLYWKVEHRQA